MVVCDLRDHFRQLLRRLRPHDTQLDKPQGHSFLRQPRVRTRLLP